MDEQGVGTGIEIGIEIEIEIEIEIIQSKKVVRKERDETNLCMGCPLWLVLWF